MDASTSQGIDLNPESTKKNPAFLGRDFGKEM
jgi:hypothetical protein